MNWPKEWVGALTLLAYPEEIAFHILEALDKVGALKEVPKPTEIKYCKRCLEVVRRDYLRSGLYGLALYCKCDSEERWVTMREVVE